MKRLYLSTGTRLVIGPSWAVTILPGGQEIHAHPNADTPRIAADIGETPERLTREHDPLHSILMAELGSVSHSMMQAAGLPFVEEVAWHEEGAVLAIQRLRATLRRHGISTALT